MKTTGKLLILGAVMLAIGDRPSPVKPRERDFYAPNSEALGRNEIRVIACGTGMGTTRPKQAGPCFLVELGNGDKFLFDVGPGSARRIAALRIPYDYLDKVFVSNLGADHIGDLATLFASGAAAGRQKPLRIWGPSGATPEWGTAYAMEHLKKSLTWDLDGRRGHADERGFGMEVTEFDYRGVNIVVFEADGVTIRSWPAIDALDGPVSYSLQWRDFKLVFGGGTCPTRWYVEYATDADIAVHECFLTVPQVIEKLDLTPEDALALATSIHTAPQAFGKVMSLVEPRMAVACRFFNDFDTAPAIEAGIRATYDGPLSLATDSMVWNVTKDEVRTRMMIVDENAWPPPTADKPLAPDPTQRIPHSDLITEGRFDVSDVVQLIYDEVNERYGLAE